MTDVSEKLQALMQQKEICFSQLSKKTGISRSTLHYYITGNTEKIPIERFKLITAALDTTPEHILGWEEKSASSEDEALNQEFMSLVSRLTPEQKALILAQIKGILSNR